MKPTSARISQLFFLALFLFLFIITEYRGKDELSVAVNSFFRTNPLVLASFVLAVKSFTLLLIPALVMTVATIVLGRFFCGWICPLGTIIDLVTNKIPKSSPVRFLKGSLKYYLLFTLLFMALFSINISGAFDPIAILIRALTFFLYPLLGHSARAGWSGLYELAGDGRDHISFIYVFLRDYILPFRETFYPLAFLSFAMFLFIIFLERFEKRNWCRNICPLGTLLGLLGRLSILKRMPGAICKDCGKCREHCATAFDGEIFQAAGCTRCMECVARCHLNRAKFSFKKINIFPAVRPAETQPVPARRILLGSIFSGLFLSKAFSFRAPENEQRLLRPPGVNDENEFMRKCVRCGECMKVCLKNALYPDLAKSGITGIFTPVVIPRLGYCEYNCTLCGQVCPTGAIPRLSLEKKRKSVIGTAVIDRNLCLPYAKRLNCIVCEEHCPVPGKAIRFETVREIDYRGKAISLKKPYIVDELCNGCGICENKCPLEGRSAIEVFAGKKLKG